MDEIVSLEKMVQKFVAENDELEAAKTSLDEKVSKLKEENEILVSKIKELEMKVNQSDEKSAMVNPNSKLDLTERENLKSQIDDLISRIDYHIRS